MKYLYKLSSWPRNAFAVFLLVSICESTFARQVDQTSSLALATGNGSWRSIEPMAKLAEIEQKFGVNFYFENDEWIKNIRYVNSPNYKLKDLFNELNSLGYSATKISADNYAIKKVDTEAFGEFSGQVLDFDTNEPLIGATILVKGTTSGAVTDLDGNFQLEASGDAVKLVVSYAGYIPKEIDATSSEKIVVLLKQRISDLDGVVVTAIGLEANKRELGYSIDNLDTDAITKSNETNLVSAISGKVAGVMITSASGSPGASANIRIRGNKSLRGNNQPLFVVDGVPIDNSSSGNGTAGVDNSNRAIDINPNDIKDMSILKGPAATALYGIRAANGAVIITTKRGQVGKASVGFNTTFSVNEVNKLPEGQRLYSQGRPSGGTFNYRGPETGEANSWGPLLSDLEFDGATDYPYDQNGRLVAKGTGNGQAANSYDAYDALFVKGITTDNNLNVSGGTEVVTYYFSAGKLYQTGIVPNADFQRTSLKGNFNAKLTEKLELGFSANYINSGGYRIQRGSNIGGVTSGVFRNPPSFDIGNGLTGRDAASNESSYMLPNGEQRSYRGNGNYDNPFWSLNKIPYVDDVNRIIGNTSLKYAVNDWLTFSYKLGLDTYSDERNFGWDINSSSNPNGNVQQSIAKSTNLNSDFLILIDKELGQNWTMNATLGHNYFSSEYLSQSAEGIDLLVPDFLNISNASTIFASQYIDRRKVYGVFGDFRFNYKGFLFINLTGRNDWSSTLPEDNNSFFYPTISTGLELMDAFHIKENPFLSYAKLRASFGYVGNDAPIYSTGTYYVNAEVGGDPLLGSNNFPAFGVNAFERSAQIGNKDLKAELTSTLELGTNLQFFDGIVDFDFTWYKSNTTDQVVALTIPAATGYGTIVRNAGRIENEGVEISLGLSLINRSDFQWSIDGTFTKYKTLVAELPDGIDNINIANFSAIQSLNVEGQPFGILNGTRWKRNDEGERIIGSDGFPIMDEDQGIIGDPNPDWFAGIRNVVAYKGLSLSFLLDIRQGGDIWNGTKGSMDYLGTSKLTGDMRDLDNFIFEGVTENGEVNTTPVSLADPSSGLAGIFWRKYGSLGLAEDQIEDGSWFRLRELTLGYDLPQSVLEKIGLQSANFSVYGRNLLLITDYSGVDPETNLRGDSNATGWDYYNLPNTRSYGASLSVKF
ncbi:SusC/RagA family TonB-linked outer membrane protein [Algoriphagus chordae]|uniref:TonB-linked SusC/RagA family outer membrane protein n=1 Tax=Algoriphagus chordae TaxID=237019 RepID=A0A2W7R0A1_9BACT|nr:SusC/RagA family TonB-linked outer membrane protein [Algoriphagus chordae]PZX52686.1 TonB-linked SusC/RagA family outer membrane protein [Algoriphagus chordae]